MVMAVAGVLAAPALAQRPAEYQVKAAYLYGFGRFVEWPASAAAAGDGAFVLCVLGEDPFGRLLDRAVEGGLLKNQPVSVRRIDRAEDSASCDTLFVSASEEPRLPRILSVLARRPVLTVGDSPDFAQRGGMIGFSVEGSRVRFTVNLWAPNHVEFPRNDFEPVGIRRSVHASVTWRR